MQVERVGGPYFEPKIVDWDTGCAWVFHVSDITEDGAAYFTKAMTNQARNWGVRGPGVPLGPIVPVRIEREPDLPDVMALHVDDGVDEITYTVDEELITERAAEVISRKLTERSPYWLRRPDKPGSQYGDAG
ncbi:hypothetical protein ABZ953_06435 [Streptomyces sp. NPDC046465]|uniref:hypothetical protein n=1 Tax=Streptomyces sp. NPDC046465 TaxID=3155810 RepID=UPI0033CDE675